MLYIDRSRAGFIVINLENSAYVLGSINSLLRRCHLYGKITGSPIVTAHIHTITADLTFVIYQILGGNHASTTGIMKNPREFTSYICMYSFFGGICMYSLLTKIGCV